MKAILFGSAVESGAVSIKSWDAPFIRWMQQLTRGGLSGPDEAYGTVTRIFRAVQIRSSALARIPYRVRDRSGDIVQWEHRRVLRPLLWLTEAGLSLNGAAYWYRIGNRARELGYLALAKDLGYRWFAPQTITPVVDEELGLLGFNRALAGLVGVRKKEEPKSREEKLDPGIPIPWSPSPIVDFSTDEIVYFFALDPAVEIGPGRSPGQVALQAAGIAKNINEFADKFFERGAIPASLLTVENVPSGPKGEQELRELEAWWKRISRGIKNAWATKAVRASVKFQRIGQPVNELAMPELKNSVKKDIDDAMGVPSMLLDGVANVATAKTARKSLYVETIFPEAEMIAATLNDQVFGPQGLEFMWLFEQMEVMQEEEAQRAGALNALVRSGVPLMFSLRILGYDIDPQLVSEFEAEIERRERLALMTAQERARLDRMRIALAQARQELGEQREERMVLQQRLEEAELEEKLGRDIITENDQQPTTRS